MCVCIICVYIIIRICTYVRMCVYYCVYTSVYEYMYVCMCKCICISISNSLFNYDLIWNKLLHVVYNLSRLDILILIHHSDLLYQLIMITMKKMIWKYLQKVERKYLHVLLKLQNMPLISLLIVYKIIYIVRMLKYKIRYVSIYTVSF